MSTCMGVVRVTEVLTLSQDIRGPMANGANGGHHRLFALRQPGNHQEKHEPRIVEW